MNETRMTESTSALPLATSTWDDKEYAALDRVIASGRPSKS